MRGCHNWIALQNGEQINLILRRSQYDRCESTLEKRLFLHWKAIAFLKKRKNQRLFSRISIWSMWKSSGKTAILRWISIDLSKKATKSTFFFENLNLIGVKVFSKSGYFYIPKWFSSEKASKSALVFEDFNMIGVKVFRKSGYLTLKSNWFSKKASKPTFFFYSRISIWSVRNSDPPARMLFWPQPQYNVSTVTQNLVPHETLTVRNSKNLGHSRKNHHNNSNCNVWSDETTKKRLQRWKQKQLHLILL